MYGDHIYYCAVQNNKCPKQNECFRYTRLKDTTNLPNATLYNSMCNENNNYLLFMPIIKERDNDNEQTE